MANYVFTCCGRTVFFPDQTVASISVPHLCLGDIPCVGPAMISGTPAPTVITTEAIDPIGNVLDGTDGGTATNGDGQ